MKCLYNQYSHQKSSPKQDEISGVKMKSSNYNFPYSDLGYVYI